MTDDARKKESKMRKIRLRLKTLKKIEHEIEVSPLASDAEVEAAAKATLGDMIDIVWEDQRKEADT